jgi:ankyrin repeat protein
MAETSSLMTPLHGACEGGRSELIQILTTGADAKKEALFNARDVDGHTPFDLAMANKHQAVVKLLKELGDPNAQSAACCVM